LADILKETFDRAITVLRTNSTEHGLKASTAYYNQIWGRDPFITFVGSNALRDEGLLKTAKVTLMTLGKTRSNLGQIPDLFNPDTGLPEYGFSGATDASGWYIIGLWNLYHTTKDPELLDLPLDAALEAYRWLRYQDANNTWLIDSPMGGDWMDAAVRRTGKTLYNNALFLMATRCIERLSEVSGKKLDPIYKLEWEELRQRFIAVFHPTFEGYEHKKKFWPYLADRIKASPPAEGLGYFVHYVIFSKFDLRFDTFSNLLSIFAGAAGKELSDSILATIKSRALSDPYPIRNLDPPYEEGDEGFDLEFNTAIPIQHRSTPYNYQNGAIWPFIGGYYVMALYSLGAENAGRELEKLALANGVRREGEELGFNEWLTAKGAEPLGQYGQSWNAGAYIGAYLASKGEKPFDFLAPD
jgi:glycogen debranching enzyme